MKRKRTMTLEVNDELSIVTQRIGRHDRIDEDRFIEYESSEHPPPLRNK